MLFSEKLRTVLLLAVLIAVSSAAGGYALSWTLSLPTGSVMVALAVGFWGVAGLKRLVETRGGRQS